LPRSACLAPLASPRSAPLPSPPLPSAHAEGNISGDNYPPPDWAVWIAQFTGILQLAGMAFMMFGDGIWDSLGGQPGWWNEVKDNKMPVFVGLFLMNSMANSQLSTGAFEIFYNGDLVFSKLAMGRMPSGREVLLTINGMRGA